MCCAGIAQLQLGPVVNAKIHIIVNLLKCEIYKVKDL